MIYGYITDKATHSPKSKRSLQYINSTRKLLFHSEKRLQTNTDSDDEIDGETPSAQYVPRTNYKVRVCSEKQIA